MRFSDLPERVREVRERIDAAVVRGGHGQRVTVVAVTKTHGPDAAEAAWEAGLPDVGENRVQEAHVLLQVNIVGEATKGGFALETLGAEGERMQALTGLHVRGVMTMAPFDADEGTLRRVFTGARDARATLASAGHDATELSMGMSNDFEIAVEEGATLVRLGTILFGARPA
ncbi:MAG: hypothetical protein DMD26_15445 [Gemmatimonadetes bacterium]|nr:MAG: hypothetical protein DMD26_15445 [Gemmatimonadota bacterium]